MVCAASFNHRSISNLNSYYSIRWDPKDSGERLTAHGVGLRLCSFLKLSYTGVLGEPDGSEGDANEVLASDMDNQ